MKKNDFILAGSFLLLALFFLVGYQLLYNKKGNYVTVTVDGKETATFPLSKDTSYTIKGKYGTNILTIKNGKATISQADCPDKLCVKQKAIEKEGETLVCLPHKVIVSISSSDHSEQKELDSISN